MSQQQTAALSHCQGSHHQPALPESFSWEIAEQLQETKATFLLPVISILEESSSLPHGGASLLQQRDMTSMRKASGGINDE